MLYRKIEFNGVEYPLAVGQSGKGAPTEQTPGCCGLTYLDTDSGTLYVCTSDDGGKCSWTVAGTEGSGVHVGPDEPTDPNVNVWVDTTDEAPGSSNGAAVHEVHIGTKEPTDPNVCLWVNPDEDTPEAGGGAVVDPKAIKQAVDSYMAEHPVNVEETDPTVPAWAKQPNKPTYTAAEVGAMPADAVLPGGEAKTKIITIADVTFENDVVLSANDTDDINFGDAVVNYRHFFYLTPEGEQIKAKRIYGYIQPTSEIKIPASLCMSAYYRDGTPSDWGFGDFIGNNTGVIGFLSSTYTCQGGSSLYFEANLRPMFARSGVVASQGWEQIKFNGIAFKAIDTIVPHFSGVKIHLTSGSLTFPVGTRFVLKAEVEDNA